MGRHARAAAAVIPLLLVLLATVDGSSDQQHEVKEDGGASLLASKLRDVPFAKQDSEARLLAKARRSHDDDIDDGEYAKDDGEDDKDDDEYTTNNWWDCRCDKTWSCDYKSNGEMCDCDWECENVCSCDETWSCDKASSGRGQCDCDPECKDDDHNDGSGSGYGSGSGSSPAPTPGPSPRPSPSPSPSPPPPPPPGKTSAPTPPPATPAPTPPPSSTSPTPAPSTTSQAKTPAPSPAPIVATPPPTTDETVKQTDFFVDVETSVSGVAIGDKGKWKDIVHQAFPQVPLESVQIDSAVVTGQGGRRQVEPSPPSTKVSATLFTDTAAEASKAKDSLSANGKIRMQNTLVRAGYPSAVVEGITVEAKTTAVIGSLPTGSSGGGTNPLIYLAALGVIPIIIVVYLIARAQSRKKAPPPNIVTNMKGELVIPLSSPPGYNPSMRPTAPEMSRDVAREIAQNQMPSAPPMHSQGMPYPGMTGAIHSGSPQYMV